MTKIYESPDKGETIKEREFTVHVPPPPEDLMNTWANETYSKQRRERLCSALADYWDDIDVNPHTLYEDMLAEIDESIRYHEVHLARLNEFRQLVTKN